MAAKGFPKGPSLLDLLAKLAGGDAREERTRLRTQREFHQSGLKRSDAIKAAHIVTSHNVARHDELLKYLKSKKYLSRQAQ